MSAPALWADPVRAWAPFEPTAGDRWDLARVAHLHRRAGFAAPWSVLQRDFRDGPTASVDRLLSRDPANEFDRMLDAMSAQLAPGAGLTRLQAIWLYRMIFTPDPLRERMTLFWHNHFATSHAKVNDPALMHRQNALLRSHALGDFRALLAAIGKDPAMLIWLDSTANRKTHPNENYAREVMELFTLGRGHYTETDVREAARAFTGWFVVRNQFKEVAAQHDAGPKTILGRTGNFDGDDIPALLLDQPSCADFLAGKLFRQFVSEVDDPAPALLAPLASALRDSGYDVRVPLAMILRSNLFFDPEVRRRRVKSPVEFAVGTIRALEVVKPTVEADALAGSCARMGQSLYAPPSVAGWDGGTAWANSATMLTRANFALALLADTSRCDPKTLAARHGFIAPRETARFLIDLLVQDGFDPKVGERIERDNAKEVATLILMAPEYQLS